MKAIFVGIGNSDDKLSQVEWSNFVQRVDKIISEYCTQKHFNGGSFPWSPWQNVAWVFDCEENILPTLKNDLAIVGRRYHQDSIAWLDGETQFI